MSYAWPNTHKKKKKKKEGRFYINIKPGKNLEDIASAFDKVWHKGLLYKLIKWNFPFYIICWIKEFIDSRYFAVRVNSRLSKNSLVETGVPQGAVLSQINVVF
jgi:hypothetical protein